MITTKQEWLRRLPTSLIEFKITCSIVKLLMLDDKRFGIAQVSEDVVVEEKTALVDTLFLLALAAHAQNWFES